MSKIFKNIAPYWRSVIIILALLFVQAWCDLSLPSYTSDIIDVGTQNRGVEHVIPEEITEEDYTSAMLFMTEEEKTLWENSYEKEDSNYVRADLSEEELEGLDEELILPLLMGVVTVLVGILEHTAKKIPHAGIFFGILKETSETQEEANMKFFHLSDLHIGLKLYNRDLLEDQKFVLQQVVEQAKKEKPDAVVIAGDIYDKAVPSAEAVSVFDWFVLSLKKEVPDTVVMMISGNHDSAPRVNLYRGILEEQKLYMAGMPPQQPEEHIQKVTMSDEWGNVNFYLLPFVRPSMVKNIVGTEADGTLCSYHETVKRLLEREEVNTQMRNVLVSHQFYLPDGIDAEQVERMDSEIRTVGNIDQVGASVLKPFDYAALGHIHKPMKVGKDIWNYCGTPLACSVSEAGQVKAIRMIEMREKGNTKMTAIPLYPRHEVKVIRGTLVEILEAASDDYVSVVLTDEVDLDVFDMQDRIYAAFPNLLEIRRETAGTKNGKAEEAAQMNRDPFQLCCAFLKDLSEEEESLLTDVINTVQEEMR